MNYSDLPGNSHSAKTQPEKKKVTPVANGTKKKKTEIEKIAGSFLADDIHSIINYTVNDVAIPYIKNMLADTAKKTIDALFYGIGGKAPSNGYSSPASKVNYVSFSNSPTANATKNNTYGYNYSDLTFTQSGAAEEVIRQLNGIIKQYGIASVADLYDLANVPSSYTDNKYGWTNVDEARIIRTNDGWVLKMPRIIPV